MEQVLIACWVTQYNKDYGGENSWKRDCITIFTNSFFFNYYQIMESASFSFIIKFPKSNPDCSIQSEFVDRSLISFSRYFSTFSYIFQLELLTNMAIHDILMFG